MTSSLRLLVNTVFLFSAALLMMPLVACQEAHREAVSYGAFDQDASGPAARCDLQCSPDGRSVVRACDGTTVETCPTELACGAGMCQEPCAAAAADRSSNGCEFYFQPPVIARGVGQSCYAAYVVNTSALPIEFTLDLEGQKLDVSKAIYRISPGETTLVPHTGVLDPGDSVVAFISDAAPNTPSRYGIDVHCPTDVVPATLNHVSPGGTGFGSSFHLVTTAPVNLTAIYPFGGALSFLPSATLLLPVPTWGKDHIVVNATQASIRGIAIYVGYPFAQLVASEDDTELTIYPVRTIQDGQDVLGVPARQPATYHLARGKFLQFFQLEELSGSLVTTNKPISVFGGHECMYIPNGKGACDTSQQELPPFEQWGSEYVGAGYRPRLGGNYEPMVYRVVGGFDGTQLEYEPAPPAGAPLTLSQGEVKDFVASTDAFIVRSQDAKHPIYLAATMSGGEAFYSSGDPEFVNVVATGQYVGNYTFYADPTYPETSLVVVRAKSGGRFADVTLDCAGILSDFQPVGTHGDYEWTRIDLARDGGPGQTFGDQVCNNGLHQMRSEGRFTATIWGWAAYASYAYPSGMAQRKLVQAPLVPIR